MTQQSPDPQSRFHPRTWGIGKILLVIAVVAAFVVMLTWDRGHFQQEQPPPAEKTKPN